MTNYIALLRGINVGGHAVKMDRLRELFVELGLHNVRSYISSGNIFFETDDTDRAHVTARIEQHLHDALGFQVPTFLRTVAELESILLQEPFGGVEPTEDTRLCVAFTKQPIPDNLHFPIASSKNDMELIAANPYEAFIVWHIINGRPPSGKFAEDIVPSANTTRFYHTLAKILTAAKA